MKATTSHADLAERLAALVRGLVDTHSVSLNEERILDLIASEIFVCPGMNVVLDGQRLPLADASLKAIAMTNVLHHLKSQGDFDKLMGSANDPWPAGTTDMSPGYALVVGLLLLLAAAEDPDREALEV